MAILKTTRGLHIKYTPLQVQTSIGVTGGVAASQTYDGALGVWEPDLRLTPCVIVPKVSIMDTDGVLEPGEVNSSLANIQWWRTTETDPANEITSVALSADEGCQIVATASDAEATGLPLGSLLVHENIEGGSMRTYVMTAKYQDPRNREVHDIRVEMAVECVLMTAALKVDVDCPAAVRYNPVRATEHEITVTAAMTVGGQEPAAGTSELTWQKLRSRQAGVETWSDVGEDLLDYECEVSADGKACTVNLKLMGYGMELRVVGKYDKDGNPSAAAGNNVAEKRITFVRQMPIVDAEIADLPASINPNVEALRPRAVVYDNFGIITDPLVNYAVDWYILPDDPVNGLGNYGSPVASGLTPEIDYKDSMDANYGSVVGVDVNDRGPLKAFKIGDKYLTIGGKILVGKSK